MEDLAEYITRMVLMIKTDRTLRDCFFKILETESGSAEARVQALQIELFKLDAPEEVTRFANLLRDPKLARIVYEEIKR